MQIHKVYSLPQSVKEELDRKLVANHFSGYVELSEWLNNEGFEISKSSLHRYGEKYQKELEAINIATEQAKAIAELLPDDEDTMAQALSRIAQTKLFGVLQEVDISYAISDINHSDESIDKISKLIASIARLNQSSVNLKKYAAEVKSKAASVADSIADLARKGGISDSTIDEIKNRILGIAK
jgi:hypothetical protein